MVMPSSSLNPLLPLCRTPDSELVNFRSIDSGGEYPVQSASAADDSSERFDESQMDSQVYVVCGSNIVAFPIDFS